MFAQVGSSSTAKGDTIIDGGANSKVQDAAL